MIDSDGVHLELVGGFQFNDRTGWTVRARARRTGGPWRYAMASGATKHDARTEALRRAKAKT